MRIFDPSDRSFRLEDLGFEDSTLEVFRHQLDRPNGLILLTGPTGSGKTTAIYSALHYRIDKWGPSFSLSTVEDPVEFNLPMISQAQINNAKGFTYPMALRSLMRQDPQVIMIGEIRDPETANIAVQAGLTGHLVISTIHSGSTTGVFARLINMELEPFLLASSVCSVLGLRLVRTICPYCIEPYLPDSAILATLPQEWVEATEFYHGVGCVHCLETGFGGRVAVTEMLVVQEPLRDGVLARLPTRQLQEIAVKEGMKTLWEMGLRRVQDRETTLEEVLRVIAVDSPLRG